MKIKNLKTAGVIIALLAATQAFSQKKEDAAKPAKSRISEKEAELMRDHKADAASAQFRPDKGLVIKTADGRFSIVTRLRAQFLYDYTDRNEAGTVDTQDFQIRRARLQFGGNMWSKHNKYMIEFAFSPRDNSLSPTKSEPTRNFSQSTPLLSWYMHFDYLRDATVRMGQYKIPYSRERVISSGDLQMVDRSLANGEFTLDRDLGLDLRSEDLLGFR